MSRGKNTLGRKPASTRVSVSLPDDLVRRLRALAGFEGVEVADVVERAVKRELVGFRVSAAPPAASGLKAHAAPDAPPADAA